MPKPDGLTLEIGCGEGRASRQLIALGHQVIAVEQSSTLSAAAATGDPAIAVIRADCAALPLESGVVGLVLASMVLQDVDDLESTLWEAARVLRAGGVLCFAIVHPFASAHDEESFHSGALTMTTPYLEERRYTDRIVRNGLSMTFVSIHRPLSIYIDILGRAGLVVDAMREFGDDRVPWLLVARAIKTSEKKMGMT
jgi:SAM-dependent methyltransferase